MKLLIYQTIISIQIKNLTFSYDNKKNVINLIIEHNKITGHY